MYLVATYVEDKYKNKNNGRRKFQIDLAMALMEEGLTRDWTGDLKNDSGRPAWNRKRGYIPCNCEVCFFCKHGHTAGVDHGKRPPGQRKSSALVKERRSENMHKYVPSATGRKQKARIERDPEKRKRGRQKQSLDVPRVRRLCATSVGKSS